MVQISEYKGSLSHVHTHDFGHDGPRLTVDIFIVVSRDYLAPFKPSYEYLRSFYAEATNINDICTILKQIHHDCTTSTVSHDLVRF